METVTRLKGGVRIVDLTDEQRDILKSMGEAKRIKEMMSKRPIEKPSKEQKERLNKSVKELKDKLEEWYG